MSGSKNKKQGFVGSVVTGTSDRVSGVVEGVFNTLGRVVSRTGKIATGTVHVAKDILTLDGKSLKKDVRGVGRSAVGAVTNVAKGTVRTARAAVNGKEDNKTKHTRNSASSKKSATKSTKKH
jgi:hypothetical protein